MTSKTAIPAAGEVWPVIRIIKDKNFHLEKIYSQIVEVCGGGAVKEGNMRKSCLLFKEDRNRVFDEGQDARDDQVGSFRTSSVQFRPCALVSTPEEGFVTPESGELPRDKGRGAGLAERLGDDPSGRGHTEAVPTM